MAELADGPGPLNPSAGGFAAVLAELRSSVNGGMAALDKGVHALDTAFHERLSELAHVAVVLDRANESAEKWARLVRDHEAMQAIRDHTPTDMAWEFHFTGEAGQDPADVILAHLHPRE